MDGEGGLLVGERRYIMIEWKKDLEEEWNKGQYVSALFYFIFSYYILFTQHSVYNIIQFNSDIDITTSS
jgi:hypothetical protein